MKYRMFSVLMVLAMVASLCVVVAAPASADAPAVTQPIVTLGNAKAGATSVSCDITVQGNGVTIDGGDVLTFKFPAEFGNLQTKLSQEVNTADQYKFFRWNNAAIAQGDLVIGSNTIVLYVPAGIGGAAATLSIYAQAGLSNPNVSQELAGGTCDDPLTGGKLYEIKVNDSAPALVEIMDHFKVASSSFAVGASTQVTCYGFSPAATVHLSGGLAGSATVGTDGTAVVTAQVTGAQVDIVAQDTTGRRACQAWAGNFNLLPGIEVIPDTGTICNPIIVKGYNYPMEGLMDTVPDPDEPIATMPNDILMGGVALNVGAITPVDLDNDGDRDDFLVTGALVPRTLAGGLYTVSAGAGIGSMTVVEKKVVVSPGAGPPGTSVNIQGTGWCPGEDDGEAILMYGNTPAGGNVTAVPIEVDDQGNFTIGGQIPDDTTSGLHGIVVYFNGGAGYNPANPNCISSQGVFTVTGRDLTMVPNSGIAMGTRVTLSGGDFGGDGKNMQPTLWVNYQKVTTQELDKLSSSGDIVPITFELSRQRFFHYGENVVEIRADINGQPMSAVTTCNIVRPTFEITPDEGSRGTTVTGTGKYWPAGETNFVTISYVRADGLGQDNIDIVKPNASGDIWTQFNIPSFTMDDGNELNLLITAKDGDGPASNQSLQETFMVTVPKITVTPDMAGAGESITVKGVGFQPKSQVQSVTVGDAPIVPVYELPLTDSKGAFTVTGKVPGVMEGGHPLKVRVTQRLGEEITTPFTVKASEGGDLTVEEVFATIMDKLVKVWTFDEDNQEWMVFDTAAGAPDDFTSMTPGQGYWVEVNQDCTWSQGINTHDMKTPWNLIGFVG